MNLQDTDLIDRFFAGELSAAEFKMMEEKIVADPEFAGAVAFWYAVYNVIAM